MTKQDQPVGAPWHLVLHKDHQVPRSLSAVYITHALLPQQGDKTLGMYVYDGARVIHSTG